MSVPQFLAYDYQHIQILADDVQDIIDQLCVELVALDWTITSGGSGETTVVFESPTRVDRAKMTVTFTRNSATQLIVMAADDSGVNINVDPDHACYIQIESAVDTYVDIYTGALYIFINSGMVAADECIGVWIFDNSPWTSLADPNPFYGATTGPNKIDATAVKTWNSIWVRSPNDYSAYVGSLYGVAKQPMGGTTNQFRFMTMSGAYMFEPCEYSIDGFLIGRLPNCLLTDYSIDPGVDLTVPLDTGVYGVFRVVGLLPYSTYANRVCIRKG